MKTKRQASKSAFFYSLNFKKTTIRSLQLIYIRSENQDYTLSPKSLKFTIN
jgi:hypothetical protein